MKKILISLLVCCAAHMAAYANDNFLGYYNFEDIETDAVGYVSKCETISTTTTNSGIKSYDFYFNGSRRLRFTGYKNNELVGNGSRTFNFDFDEYTTQKYPGTKLVVGYDEITDYRNATSYTQTMIRNKAGNQIMQLFVLSHGGAYCYRANNNGNYYPLSIGELYDFRYIADLDGQTFEQVINGVSQGIRSNQYKDVPSLSRISWTPGKEEIYSIDNIYAVVVPDKFDASVQNSTIGANSGELTVWLTAPADKYTMDKIKVYKNGSPVNAETELDFRNSCIKVRLSGKLSYNSEYVLRLEKGFKDIAGNSLEKEFKLRTESAPEFEIKTTFSYEGNDTCYSVTAKNMSKTETDGCILVALYNSSGVLVKCAYFRQSFGADEEQSISGVFKNASDCFVKAFVGNI